MQVRAAHYEATIVNVPKRVDILPVSEWPDTLDEVQIILKVGRGSLPHSVTLTTSFVRS